MVAVWFILSHGIYDPFRVIFPNSCVETRHRADMTSVLAAVGWLVNLDPTIDVKKRERLRLEGARHIRWRLCHANDVVDLIRKRLAKGPDLVERLVRLRETLCVCAPPGYDTFMSTVFTTRFGLEREP